MALSVVQTKVTNPVDNANSSAASFGSTPTVGNLIVVTIFGWRSSGFFLSDVDGSVVDNQGNTYNYVAGSNVDVTNGGEGVSIFWAIAATSSGTFTITVDPASTGNYFSWTASEVSGASATPLDVTTSKDQGNPQVTAVTTGSTSTTAQNNEIVFAVMAIGSSQASITVESVSPTWVEDAEQLDSSLHQPGEIDHRIISSTGTQSCSWTAISNGRAGSAIVTFKQATTGTTYISKRMLMGVG